MTQDIYQIKITLAHSIPRVWRRVQVYSDTKLPHLHRIIQCVMGWWDYHLHEFEVGEKRYGVPDHFDDYHVLNQKGVPLTRLAKKKGEKFTYVYDFGDWWAHELEVEDILPADPDTFYPLLLDGEYAGPPEDVGGIAGYAEFLEAIADPGNEYHEQFLEWIGGEWDMETFKPRLINLKLQLLRYGPRGPLFARDAAD